MMLPIVGAMLALGALAWVLLPLLSRRDAPLADGADAEEASTGEDRLELALDVAAGRLARGEFERLTAELR